MRRFKYNQSLAFNQRLYFGLQFYKTAKNPGHFRVIRIFKVHRSIIITPQNFSEYRKIITDATNYEKPICALSFSQTYFLLLKDLLHLGHFQNIAIYKKTWRSPSFKKICILHFDLAVTKIFDELADM